VLHTEPGSDVSNCGSACLASEINSGHVEPPGCYSKVPRHGTPLLRTSAARKFTAAIPRLRLWREESFWWRWLYPSFPWMGARAFGLARHLSAFHNGRKIRWDDHNMHDVHDTSLWVGDTIPYRSDAEMGCLLFRLHYQFIRQGVRERQKKRTCLGGGRVRILIIPPISFDCIYLTLVHKGF
jgi:hypothetical protein